MVFSFFILSTLLIDLHNDRSFHITARGKPWKICQGFHLCPKKAYLYRGIFVLWRPPNPLRKGSFLLTEEKRKELLQEKDYFFYIKRAYNDLLQEGFLPTKDLNTFLKNPQAIFLGIEGLYLLGKWEEEKKEFLKNYVFYVGLTWNNQNPYAGTPYERWKGKGLTKEGKKMVIRLLENNVLIDLSHASWKTVEDFYLFTQGKYPLFFSHSNAYTLCKVPRNIPDKILPWIQKTKGLVGINFHSPFLRKKGRATIKDVIRHIKYFYQHKVPVAIGSDFDGLITPPSRLRSPKEVHRYLKEALKKEGFSSKEILDIFYLNAVKFFSYFLKNQKKWEILAYDLKKKL